MNLQGGKAQTNPNPKLALLQNRAINQYRTIKSAPLSASPQRSTQLSRDAGGLEPWNKDCLLLHPPRAEAQPITGWLPPAQQSKGSPSWVLSATELSSAPSCPGQAGYIVHLLLFTEPCLAPLCVFLQCVRLTQNDCCPLGSCRKRETSI